MSEYRQRRSAHTPAAQGSKWVRRSTRWAIYHRDGFACVYCGAIGPLSLDHVRAVENGGQNHPSNLATCCVSCNSSKQGIGPRAWYRKLRERGLDTTAIRKRIARLIRKPIDRERGRFLARCVAPDGDPDGCEG